YRDRVIARVSLAIGGEVIAAAGAGGEIEKVLRDAPGGVAYEVRFPGRTLQVPETALAIDPENLNELQKQKLAEQEAVDG
ncbi:MAG: nitrogen fixation protein NifZ, partial [Zetaproteobacteria bacterium CG12_big_fil_rev_8_21_14_0_65_54_13]